MGYLFYDDFNRSDSTTDLGTNVGTGSLATQTWQQHSGVWGISSNQAYASTHVSGANASIALGTPTQDVSVLISALGAGVTFRRNQTPPNQDYWRFTVNTSGTLQLFETNGGVNTQRGSDVSGGNVGDVLRVTAIGNDITCYQNGVSVITYSSASLDTNTDAGIIATNSAGRIDTFWASVTSIKSVDGLAYSSVKTVNGLAVASIQSIDGLV